MKLWKSGKVNARRRVYREGTFPIPIYRDPGHSEVLPLESVWKYWSNMRNKVRLQGKNAHFKQLKVDFVRSI